MIALQSSPPRPGPALAALAVLVLAGGLVGAVGNVVVQRLSDPVGRYRLLYALVLLPATLVAYGLLALLGLGPAVLAPIPVPSGIASAVLGDFLEFLAAGLVWLGAYAPTVRGLSRVRDIDLPTGRALVRMVRYVVGVSAVLAVALAPLRVAPPGADLRAVAASFGILVIVFVLASPWIVALLRSTRPPDGAVAERLAALRNRAGLEVRDVAVIDTDDEETANAIVRGPPGYRRLFVTSTFLDRFDDDTAAAFLAIRTGRLRSHVLAFRTGTVLGGAFLLAAAVTGAGSQWLLLGSAVGVVLAGFRLSRRGVLAGDDYAADRVGASAVVDALERYARVHAMEPTRRRFPNPLSANVALGDRIDRLRERTNGEPARDPAADTF